MAKDKQGKPKSKKHTENQVVSDVEETEANADSIVLASVSATANANNSGEMAGKDQIDLKAILMEIKDFRKENAQQFEDVKAELCKTNARLEEAECRILDTEERVQTMEDIVIELLQLQSKLQSQLTDQEGRSRRNNIRIYGVNEDEEKSAPTMIDFVENLLREKLQLPPTLDLHIERAHRALTTAPPAGVPPRSIIARFMSFKTKDEILRKAWQMKGFQWKGKQINLDHDYAPDVLKQRQAYTESKRILKQRGIRFQTPFPAKLRVFFPDGTKLYSNAEEATEDMAERGFPVRVLKQPETLTARIKKLTWSTKRKPREQSPTPEEPGQAGTSSIKERLQQFRRDTS